MRKTSDSKVGKGLRVLSFFTGCGGLDLGFEQAGFETVFATDIDSDCCETLKLNLGTHFNKTMRIKRADINDLKVSALPKNIDLVIGGPPCQSFSASGRRAGGAAGRLDDRGKLFQSYCDLIEKIQPSAFVFENVRGILGTNKGEDWKAVVSAFEGLGYSISYRLLDALDYGAPQQRERMFLVGHKLQTDFLFPEPTYGPDSFDGTSHITVAEAFEQVVQTEDLDSLILKGGKYSHLLQEVPPGQNYLFFTAKRGYPTPIFAYRSRFSDFLYKANPNAPSKTIIASPGKYTGPLHWENRYFSVPEYMRLQGFPDDFKFYGNRSDTIRQIGNSVSPKIAFPLALAIATQVFGRKSAVRLVPVERRLSFDKRKGEKAQLTRAFHDSVANSLTPQNAIFSLVKYRGSVEPSCFDSNVKNVIVTHDSQGVKIRVNTDRSKKPFARMVLKVGQSLGSRSAESNNSLKVRVEAYGETPATVQAMWNAVDDWVRNASSFHSLFELYGHFTEPHPFFDVVKFEALNSHPIVKFAKHASDFKNCSRYFPKKQLIDTFGKTLKTEKFNDIADYLRAYRFDIRSKETNIAIESQSYMVAYPFNLPARRQMNFRVHDRIGSNSEAIA